MNISELNKKYTLGELTSTEGDKNLRYELLSPLFKNLYENKVVYHERFTSIVLLENIKLTPDLFEATAINYLLIEAGRIKRYRPLPEKWSVGANWKFLRLSGNCLSPYSSWLMWTDPELVEKVEKLVKAELIIEALKLTLNAE